MPLTSQCACSMPHPFSLQVPVCASIWSCSSECILSCSARSILSFMRNHHLLQVRGSNRRRSNEPETGSGSSSLDPCDTKDGAAAPSGCLQITVSSSADSCSIVYFCRSNLDRLLLQIFGRPRWLTVSGRSRVYVDKASPKERGERERYNRK